MDHKSEVSTKGFSREKSIDSGDSSRNFKRGSISKYSPMSWKFQKLMSKML
ncbi:unnamed protein product [Larinioides sclopetarius]|uniref:Uncharacterized protein n=1 Tax=Larinioides sclopetarius TaxID=280406 RepID=A0AAV1ZJ22_9ARAC